MRSPFLDAEVLADVAPSNTRPLPSPYAAGERESPSTDEDAPRADEEFVEAEEDTAAEIVVLGEDSAELDDEADADVEHDASRIEEALSRSDWREALRVAIEDGERDESQLANLLLFARHKELDPKRRLDPKSSKTDAALAREWAAIREREVWPAIEASAESLALGVHGKHVASEHRVFWRSGGQRFKQLVAWAAQEVDMNAGLLATALVAETGGIASYLASGKVSSYHVGVDDFFAMRATLAAKVPAYKKIGWNRKQAPTVHLNDAKTRQRNVQTIEFDSGRDALLATAVYLKYAELRLREDAVKAGSDFDALPVETRFALTRMSMAAGRAGAATRLYRALKGEDILVRDFTPPEIYKTDRNATIRAAQALHLSDWIFGLRLAAPAAVQPETIEVDDADGSDEIDEVDEVDEAELELDEAFEWVVVREDEAEDDEDEGEAPVLLEHDGPRTPVREVAVGQRIELDLDATAFAGKIDKVQWTIPGRFVRGYEGSARNAALFELAGTDLQQSRISFFWVDAQDGRTVRAKIRTKAGTDDEFTAVFDVKGPTIDEFSAKVGITRIEKRAGLTGMRFGKLVVAPGIKWHWKITLPAGHAGHVKDVQTLLQDRWQVLALEKGGAKTRKIVRRHPAKSEPHLQLDGHAGGQAIYTTGLSEPLIGAGASFTNAGSSDSPHTELPPLGRRVSVNDQFTYFVMFKPHTPKPQDAIWVPVAKATWFWKSIAQQRAGKWLVNAAKMKPAIDKKTVDFPKYESDADENDWQDAAP